MREYEFRGKRLDNNKWVYGYYVENKCDNHFIYEVELQGNLVWNIYEVNPSTIGQFTGMFDKNGKRIYEHDLIKVIGSRSKSHFISEIVWDNDACGFGFQCSKIEGHMDYMDSLPHNKELYSSYYDSCEIIGNIHNKENK